MDFFPKTPNIDFLGKRRLWLSVSSALIFLTLVSPFLREPNWGVDFAGGTEMQVKFGGPVDVGAIRANVKKLGLSDATIQEFGDAENYEYLVRVGRSSLFTNEQFASTVEPKLRDALASLLPGDKGIHYAEKEGDQVSLIAEENATLSKEQVRAVFVDNGWGVQDIRTITDGHHYAVIFRGVGDKVEQSLAAAFKDLTPQVQRVDQVGAAVGNELKVAAIKSMLLAIALILLYVGFRFDFRFAPGGIVALAHDAVLTVGFYLVAGLEINTTTIAAVLAIIGFSINDTIVIFDRVRENSAKHKGRELTRLINESINESLSRTILTSVTTLLALIGLIFFTVGSLREFSMAIAFGVIVGTYSTIYIASPIVLWVDATMKARRDASSAGTRSRRVAEAK